MEALNIAGLAWAPRLEDERKYGVIWYESICQSPYPQFLLQGTSYVSHSYSEFIGCMNNPSLVAPPSATHNATLSQVVEHTLGAYFDHLEGNIPTDLYNLVIEQVEQPLFVSTLAYTGGNQSKTAKILGISRTTLRKKLIQHELLSEMN